MSLELFRCESDQQGFKRSRHCESVRKKVIPALPTRFFTTQRASPTNFFPVTKIKISSSSKERNPQKIYLWATMWPLPAMRYDCCTFICAHTCTWFVTASVQSIVFRGRFTPSVGFIFRTVNEDLDSQRKMLYDAYIMQNPNDYSMALFKII